MEDIKSQYVIDIAKIYLIYSESSWLLDHDDKIGCAHMFLSPGPTLPSISTASYIQAPSRVNFYCEIIIIKGNMLYVYGCRARGTLACIGHD